MDTNEPKPGITPQEVVKPEPQPDGSINTTRNNTKPHVESSLKAEKIKDELDPRRRSKKFDQEGRNKTKLAILEARARSKTAKENIAESEQQLQEIARLTSASYQNEREKTELLTQRLEALIVKLKSAVGVKDSQVGQLQKEIDAIRSERKVLRGDSYATEDELKALKAKQKATPNPKQLLEAYYEKVATQPLSNEQKRDLLKPEALASLSTEEYIALWKRLNPFFLSHVTRQGFRDHTGGNIMVFHRSGYREFVNGFIDVMKNGRSIFPPLARIGLINRDETTVKAFMASYLSEATNADQAKEMTTNLLLFHFASAPKYADITSTHLAAQIVSDYFYGGERGNEVFFIYPSDVLASQYAFAFNGWEKDFTRLQSETKWNDVFIWTDPNRPGIPVDSGIVFLPEKTLVDPETGSKYASEIKVVDGKEIRVMIEDPTLVSSFIEWGKKIDDQSPLKKAFTLQREEKNYSERQYLQEICLTAFIQDLESLGFSIDAAAVLVDKVIGEMYYSKALDEEFLQKAIKESDTHWKRAKNTIPAKEYWEGFFAKNSHLRPKHLQYYDGNPTTAVYEFQQQNNIGQADTSKTEGQLLGFDDHHVVNMEKDPRANVGYDELVAMADEIIKGTFPEKTKFF